MPVEPSKPGRRVCMSCGREFLSRDVALIRRCDDCKKKEDTCRSPRVVRVSDVSGAIGQYGSQ